MTADKAVLILRWLGPFGIEREALDALAQAAAGAPRYLFGFVDDPRVEGDQFYAGFFEPAVYVDGELPILDNGHYVSGLPDSKPRRQPWAIQPLAPEWPTSELLP